MTGKQATTTVTTTVGKRQMKVDKLSRCTVGYLNPKMSIK